ncbi:MAG TPA: PAS domain S-box protein [Terriglobales bacterium]
MPRGIFSHIAIKDAALSPAGRFARYILAAFLGLLAIGISLLLPPGFSRPTLMVAILAVLISALSDGRVSGWIAVASSLVGFFLLNSPGAVFVQPGQMVLLIIYLAVSLAVIEIVHRLRREQRKLLDRDHRLRMAQRAAHIWFWEIDLSAKRVHWSRETLEIDSNQRAEVSESLEDYLQHRVYAEDAERVRTALANAIEDRHPYEIEYRVHHQDGNVRWIASKGKVFPDAHGQPAMMLGMTTDISMRKQAEKAKTRFSAMLASLAEGVCYFDLDGRVEYLNPAAQTMLGCKPESACGSDIHELVHAVATEDASHRRKECAILKTLQTGRPIHVNEESFRNHSGRLLTVEYTVAPVNYEGSLIGAVLSFRDIYERKRAEEALRSTEKLATTGRIAATISHELNNPLESVNYLLYLIGQSGNLGSKEREYLRTAEHELGRMEQIVKQTLGFHRQGATPVPISIAKLLKGILLLYGKKLEHKKISVVERYDFSGDIPVYPAEIRQVFSNLIVNAVEAMGEGGRLVLHVAPAHEWRGGLRQGIRVSIFDNGPGIREEARKHLFEPFFTTKGERGTGIGLWVSSGIVEKHTGHIRLRSNNQPGKSYTCFSVFLPMKLQTGEQRLPSETKVA